METHREVSSLTGDHWRRSGITDEDGSSDWPADGNESPVRRSRGMVESVALKFTGRGDIDQLLRLILVSVQ